MDWKLLCFLVFFLNVKLAIKIPTIAIIYLLQFDFKFGFTFKNPRLSLFYPFIILIAIFNWLIGGYYSNLNYNLVFINGIFFWILCLLAMQQVKLFIEKNDVEIIHQTIIAFFILNAILSFFNLASIVIETGTINPYTYQGQYQKYFINTGDYIKGLTFDTSSTNAILNAFGVVYFLTKKNTIMLLLCMITMLATGSNCVNIILLFLLLILFIFKSNRNQKSLILICLMFVLLFMTKISPQNYEYIYETIKNTLHIKPEINKQNKERLYKPITLMPDSLLTTEEIKLKIAYKYIDSIYYLKHKANKSLSDEIAYKGRIVIPEPDINTQPYQHIIDTNNYQKHLLAFISTHKNNLPLSSKSDAPQLLGKITSWLQTLHFLAQHPLKAITGNGIGNFSSKLAFRASGLGFAGGYPEKYTYINPDFLSNHLDVYLNYFSKKTDLHSLTNSPNSVYDQLISEYGILGLIIFVIWYVGYFLKHYKILTYGLPILFMTMAFLLMEYWFEQLSILLFFELLLLLDIKENSSKIVLGYAH